MEVFKKKSKALSKRSLSRLMACQALCMYYDKNNENKNLDFILDVINQYYIENILSNNLKKNKYIDVKNSDFTTSLVNGVINNYQEFDSIIEKFLQKQDTIETLDDVILESLRLATYELKNHKDTDKNVIISEYVDIIAEFYDGVYITFANGILDNIALYIRDNEIKKLDNPKNKNEDLNKVKKTKLRKVITLKKK